MGEVNAEADRGSMGEHGQKGKVGPTLQGQKPLPSRCLDSWLWASPKQTRHIWAAGGGHRRESLSP